MFAQSCPSGPRVPFAGHNLPLDSLPDPAPMTAVRVWPNLSFDSATSLAFAPDGSGFALVTEQQGHVHVLPTDPNATSAPLFLDLTNGEVQFDNAEQGMLSVTFDPNWATNHYIYVDYVAPGSRCQSGTYCTKVARYTQSATNPSQADPASRRAILEAPDNNNYHNGGQLQFGPDGMLYVSIGDGGTMNGQDTSKLLGVIVRIDPNGGNPYAIPPGNPFIGQAGKRAEIWDYGLRNPWRFTFDRLTGDLWVGDVGEGSWEEADFVPGNVPGQNFGWPFCEGTHDYGGNSCASIQSTLPVLEYPHDSNTGGFAIMGGYVYRGDLFPELYGAYLYADEVSGHVWAYNPASHASTRIAEMTSPVSWAQDTLGELTIVSHAGGLYRLQPTQGSGTQQFPTALSATGLFTDTTALTPKPGLVEYDVISPLWSDGALKRRWLALPAGQTIGFSADDPWTFPVGTVFVKHFELQVTPTTRRRVETRVLLRQVDRWVGYTYRWNTGQTDATLLTASMDESITITGSGGSTQQNWHYPSPSECLGCHTAASGRVLGMRTRQLNHDFTYAGGADNELHAFGACLGLFASSIESPSFYPAIADPSNTSESLNARARSYLAANCAHCHQPGGPAPGSMDMRYEPLLGAMNLIGVAPISGDLGISGAQRIKPGASAQSVLWARIASTDPTLRMAKGSQIPDPLAVSLFQSWIDTGLGTIDSDGDGDADSADNCPYEPNPTQSDAGGWLSSTPDGIGDSCQCGNVDANGTVASLDLTTLRQYLAGNRARAVANVARLVRFPDVSGRPSVLDFAHLKRAQAGAEPPYSQTCAAATRLLP